MPLETRPPHPFVILAPHGVPGDEVVKALDSSLSGLKTSEAVERGRICGPNRLPLRAPRPPWRRFLAQFQNALLYLLIGSGCISLLLQHYVDAGVIFAVVLINGIVGFIQEGKAEAAIHSIMSMTRTTTVALREGNELVLDSEALVPGDVVRLQPGDKVPADLRLLRVRQLECDESALTGESVPVKKSVDVLDADCDLAERANIAHMGTLVAAGTATGIVIRTGSATEIGQINELVQSVALPKTPLQVQLERLTGQLAIIIIALALAVMLFGTFVRQYAFADMFQAAIGIAVASIPEAIPAVVTVILALSVLRMARNHALVRRLPAVEVLGSVDVICSDKTGTLTANRMAVRELVTANRRFLVSGEGYHPEGEVRAADGGHADDPALAEAARIAALCNDARITFSDHEWHLSGDPTEGALLAFAMKSGLESDALRDQFRRVDEAPFDPDHGLMATLNQAASGPGLLAVKGAPDRLLDYCSSQFSSTGSQPLDRQYWDEKLAGLARQGMRVLALARITGWRHDQALEHQHAKQDLEMVALAGISDPPRPEAIESIRRCHAAGIDVKMITGDNPVTAAAIGRELGLAADTVLTGHQVSALSPPELARQLDVVDIFARTSPDNKLQIVTALEQHGHVVAMTGDGVNDAPALRKANIGVAMGKRGTDAAREAADFVLTDDNFATITRAIEEGRTVYDNIVKSMVFILPTSIAEALVITTAILLGLTLPITPAQILWVNMITAVTLSLALVFEEGESNIMHQPPRPGSQTFITPALLRRLLLVGVGGALIVFLLFRHYLNQGHSIEMARSVAVTAQVLIEAFYLLNCRYLYQTIFHTRLLHRAGPVVLAIAAVILIQAGFCYLPVMQRLFEVTAIGLLDWLLIAACASTIVLVVELEKVVFRQHRTRVSATG